MNDDIKDVLDTIDFYYKSGIIDFNKYSSLKMKCNGSKEEFQDLLNELVSIYRNYNQTSISSNVDDIYIEEVNDGDLSAYTGVIPFYLVKERLAEINGDDSSVSIQTQSIGGKQKKFGTLGNIPWTDENGIVSFLLITFLTGISVGIISMIVLNFVA